MLLPNDPLALYVHIPFCHARCGYCDFVTFTGQDDRVAGYVSELLQEAEFYSQIAQGRPLRTVFLGGGTPSILKPVEVTTLFDGLRRRFTLQKDCEVSLEANPESVTSAKAAAWIAAGVNRVSMGLQTMDDTLLARLGRLHTAAQFLAAYRVLRDNGFVNLSIDLIYGLPEQSVTDWQDTLRRTADLGSEHLSLYALSIEENTPFAAAKIRVHSDTQAEMYGWAREFLIESGYVQYEVSNFARPGYECRHNLVYWRQNEYLALGVGAVGCIGRRRWENVKTLERYARALSAGERPIESEEILDSDTVRFERLMLGLRLREGLIWGEEPDPTWRAVRARLNQEGLLEEVAGRWRIPECAIALTNQILLPFLR